MEGDNIMVTVIIPHIPERDILPTYKSILLQRYDPIEIVIKTDSQKKGANWTRNEGFLSAVGRYVFFCDDDIILKPKCISKMVKALEENKDCDYAYCDYIKKFGNKTGQHTAGEWSEGRLRQNNFISTMSLIRKDKFPGFDESIEKLQDWDLWLTMLDRGSKGVYIPEVLFTAICNNDGISEKGDYQKWHETIKQKHLGKDQ
jgi:glycosyltransferase involved in cell wall biosynthesis